MRRDIVRMHLDGTDAKSNVTTWLRLRHECVRSNVKAEQPRRASVGNGSESLSQAVC